MLDFFKHPGDTVQDLELRFEGSIMSGFLSSIFPQSLYSIEFWGVRWQIVNLYPLSVFAKPIPYVAVLVVRCPVLNVVNPSIFLEEFTDGSFQENRVGLVIEDFVDHEFKLSRTKIHASENFN